MHYGADVTSMPYRPGFPRLPTEGSTAEDFRSVIDDLTVANKKLKQKLRKYEKLHAAHLQNEKLFEVKFHGVPDHKKKELEDLLRTFAVSLSDGTPQDEPIPLKAHQTMSSTHATESGYATMSGSGQNSMSASGPSGTGTGADSDLRKISKSNSTQYNQQQSNVRSYLHDIPAGLLPRQHVPMSDAARKKLVVRRLEQVFAGKLSTPTSNHQPQQQEEVAQSAAMADRIALGVSNKPVTEGHREALIMPMMPDTETGFTHPATGSGSASLEPGSSDHSSPDQRPTRPLDLDPARAQVPAENVEYMRHLGFTLPSSGESPHDEWGWVYLNFLINMAQLHTINVTPDFVKDALKEYSTKFELSHDGRKVRWRGGHDLTMNSSDSSSEHLSGGSLQDQKGGNRSRSRLKRPNTNDPAEGDKQARKTRFLTEKERNKLNYTPLFFHRQDSEEDDIYNGISSSSNSPPFAQPHGDSSGFTSAGFRSESSRKKRDEGPMIFYSKANFCTDLSGDRQSMAAAVPTTSYNSITAQPLGTTHKEQIKFTTPFGITEPRGPLDAAEMDLDPKDPGVTHTSSEDEFALSLPELRSDAQRSPMTIDFKASGLGGVHPEDNFAISVKRQQVRSGPSPSAGHHRRKSMYNKKILDVLDEESRGTSPPVIKERILSTSQQVLPSSELPPASFLPFDSTSSGGVDSDLESDVSSTPSTSSSKAKVPTTATPQVYHISPMHRANTAAETSSGSISEDEEMSDNPSKTECAPLETVETASDNCTYGTDDFKEIPPGSSAATAGGGSGFNSPLDFGTDQIDISAVKTNVPHRSSSAASPPAGLKRARTSDSINAALQEPLKTQRLQ